MAGFIAQDHDEVMSEINMVPFIDVMLVLLVIFIITVPVMKHAVNVQLPRAANEKEVIQPQTLRLTVQADGSYWLDEQKLADDQLGARLQAAAARQPQPDLHIRGDRDVRYERVAQAMAAAQQAGLSKIGFVTEPPQAPRWRRNATPPARPRAGRPARCRRPTPRPRHCPASNCCKAARPSRSATTARCTGCKPPSWAS